ncbi:MAG: M23 family metallopeptidase [Phycisphaerae bacterium]|nr:M23 family metallopeptidase [Gemmatimonadaceae bacterium]
MRKLCVAALTVIALAGQVQAQQVGRAPLSVEVSSPPTALLALGRWQMVYEVRLVNFGAESMVLSQLDVLDSTGAVVGSWKDAQLAQRILKIGNTAPRTPQNLLEVLQLAPGQVNVAFLLVALQPGRMTPSTIHHRVITRTSGVTDTTMSRLVTTSASTVIRTVAPVAPGTWVALRGPSNSSGHRLSFVAQGGQSAIPQRYAVDWAMLGEDGRLFRGDSAKLENWYGYGTPVTAIARGRVVWVRDGMSERAPFGYSAPAQIEAADAVGNCIIVDLGGGQFATFAHLKPGSVRVKAGDQLSAGQVIGEVGNSGNSLAPHLHFHISNAPGVLAGEGLPFALETFELVGRVSSSAALLAGVPWVPNAAQPSRTVINETPLENMVVRFTR